MESTIKLTPNTDITPTDIKFIEQVYTFLREREENALGFGEFCILFNEFSKKIDPDSSYDVFFRDNYVEIWKVEDHDLKQQGYPGFIMIR